MADATPDKSTTTKAVEAKPSTHKTHTIPAGQTDDGKPKTVKVAPDAQGQTFAETLSAGLAPDPETPQYTSVDFGDAGTLKLEPHGKLPVDVIGAGYDLPVRVSDTETYLLRGVPVRFLKSK